jgi:hypothetical protein
MGYGGFKQNLFPAQVLRNLFYKSHSPSHDRLTRPAELDS